MPSQYVRTQAAWYNWATNNTYTATAANVTWNNWVGVDPGTTSTGYVHYINAATTNTGTVTTWDSWIDDSNVYRQRINTTWGGWVTTPQIYTPNQVRQAHGYSAPAYAQPRETEAERIAREEHWARVRAEQDAARVKRDLEQAEARIKALELLTMVLTKDQVEEYKRTKSFKVRGSHGRRYRVHHGTSGNVRQIIETPDGKEQEVASLCAHPRMYDAEGLTGHGPGYLPTEDCLAAQALALMTDEEKFIATANIHRGRLQPA